jgi:foldase protein PrsA
LKRTILLIIAAASLVLSVGCSKRENLTVAKVGDRTITVADFEKAAATIDEKYLPRTNDLKGKKELLDHMIDKDVMALKAIAAGYEKDKDFVELYDQWKNGFLVAALDDEFIIKKVTVTEQQVKDYFDRMNDEYSISQIVVPGEDQAWSLREQILGGADFAELARKYSVTPDAAEGGYIGPTQIGMMYYWVEEALVNMKAGEISKPLATTNGWALIKLDNIKKVPPQHDMEYARKRVRAIAQKKAIDEMRHKIEKEENVTVFPEAVDIAYNSLPEDIPFGDIINYKVTRDNAPKLEIPEQYQGMIIAQYSGGSYTLKDFMKIYESLGLPDRPRRQAGKESIVALMNQTILDKILPVYAEEKLKILNIPEVAEKLKARKEQFLVFRLYQDQVKKHVAVSEVAVRDFYNAHSDSIMSPERRQFNIILVSTKEQADKVASLARQGQDFGKLAATYSEDTDAKENMGNTGLTPRGVFSDYDAVAFALPVGKISDPFQVPRGWAIVKVSRIEAPKPVDFADAANTIRSSMMEAQADSMLKTKLKEWRADFPVKVFERNLAKAELKRTGPPQTALQEKAAEQSQQPAQ